MIKITGLRNLERKLKRMQRAARDLEGTHEIPLSTLFHPRFMQANTSFNTVEEMFEASGFKVETAEDFDAVPDDEWDKFVAANTTFPDWESMMAKAARGYTLKKLGL